MSELMRRHVNAEIPLAGIRNLFGEGSLALANAFLRDEEMAIHVGGAEARQYVTTIPSQPTGNLVGDLTHNVLPLGLGVTSGDVKEQLAPRTIWFAEVLSPAQGAQVLWPQWQGEHDINCDRNLGFDEADAAALKIPCNFPHQLLGKKIKLGAKALGL